jgi:undecaprenyl-diphosphatase
MQKILPKVFLLIISISIFSGCGLSVNSFDYQVTTFINQLSQQSWVFDKSVLFLSDTHLLKGGVLMLVIWWAWFKDGKNRLQSREHIISTLMSCIFAIAVARFLALMLPFRLRPLHEPELNFLLPFGMSADTLSNWSSFPSDHAVLFFTLSAGLFFISRRMCTFALLYTTLFILFPRIYLGLHYLTDIVMGAIIAIVLVVLGNMYVVKSKMVNSIVKWSNEKPEFFYPLFFLVTYQIIELFDGSRKMIEWIVEMIKSIIG